MKDQLIPSRESAGHLQIRLHRLTQTEHTPAYDTAILVVACVWLGHLLDSGVLPTIKKILRSTTADKRDSKSEVVS